MADKSIRQYATKKYIAQKTGLAEGSITDTMISEAELFIDSWVADNIGDFGPFIDGELLSTGSFTTTGVTDEILKDNDHINFYSFCNIEILSGELAGTILKITESAGNSATFEAVEGLSGNLDYRLFQAGKFPRYVDCAYLANNKYMKTIPFEVKEAVAYQVKYMEDEPDIFEESGILGSESISESYSYSVGQGGGGINALSDVKYIAPKARVLLKKLRIQTTP